MGLRQISCLKRIRTCGRSVANDLKSRVFTLITSRCR